MMAREGKKLSFSFSRKYRRRMADNNAFSNINFLQLTLAAGISLDNAVVQLILSVFKKGYDSVDKSILFPLLSKMDLLKCTF